MPPDSDWLNGPLAPAPAPLIAALSKTQPGSFTIVAGPPGCGRSTTLNALHTSWNSSLLRVVDDKHVMVTSSHNVGREANPNVRALSSTVGSRREVLGLVARLVARHPMVLIDDGENFTQTFGPTLMKDMVAASPRASFVVAGRGSPETVAGESAEGAQVIPYSALMLNTAQVAGLAERYGLACSDRDAAKIVHDTDGWPVAVRWILSNRAGLVMPATPTLSDYIRTHCLSGLSADELRLLSIAAALEEVSPEVIQRVMPEVHVMAMFTACRERMPMLSVDRGVGPTLRVAPVLANTIEVATASSGFRWSEQDRRTAAAAAEQMGKWQDAFQILRRVGDLAELERFLYRNALRLAFNEEAGMVDDWLRTLTLADIKAHPGFAVVHMFLSVTIRSPLEIPSWLAIAELGTEPVVEGLPSPVVAALQFKEAFQPAGRPHFSYEMRSKSHRPWIVFDRLRAAAVDLQNGDAEQAMNELLATAPGSRDYLMFELYRLTTLVYAAQAADRPAARSEAIRELAAMYPRSTLRKQPLLFIADAVLAMRALELGDHSEAEAWLDVALRKIGEGLSDGSSRRVIGLISLAESALALNRSADAAKLIEHATATAAEFDSFRYADQRLPALAEKVRQAHGGPRFDAGLTGAELQVLRYLNSDLRVDEIAERLFVAPSTVKAHVKSVYRKLSVSSRRDAVGRGRALGLLDQDLQPLREALN